MLSVLLGFLTGPIVDKLLDVFKASRQADMSDTQLKAEVEKAVVASITDVASKQSDVILAEIKSEDLITRIWRPVVALSFSFILFFYGLLLPIAVDWIGAPPVRVGDKLLEWIFTTVTICLGGYIGGRSLEKITDILMRGRK